jgi:very-short-patch-repair endonuclease
MTPAESAFWLAVRRNQLGLRVRRQVLIIGYIADFYCPLPGVIIEIDGPIHDDRRLADAARDFHFSKVGLVTLRLSNHDVLSNLPGTISTVRGFLADSIAFRHEFGLPDFPVRFRSFRRLLASRAIRSYPLL